MIKKYPQARRQKIKRSIRKKMSGTTERPRLTVYKSLNHFYAQVVDDSQGKVLVAASTLSKDLREELKTVTKRMELAKHVGTALGRKAVAMNIRKVVFDRNGYLYHGNIKAIADGAREAGLEF